LSHYILISDWNIQHLATNCPAIYDNISITCLYWAIWIQILLC